MPRRDDAYKDARRAEIVDAARDAALDKGVAHVTMRDISERAGMSMGAITNYFERREQIVREAAEHGASQRRAWLQQLAGHDHPVRALARSLAESAADPTEGVLELGLISESTHDDGLREVVQASAAGTVSDITSMLAASGEEPRRAKTRARQALALYYGLLAMARLDQPVPRKHATALLTHCLEGELP